MPSDDLKTDFIDNFSIQNVLDSSPTAALVVDRLGNIIAANLEVYRIFGYEADELTGQSIENLLPESFRKKHQSDLQRFFKNPVSRLMGQGRFLQAVRKNGSIAIVEIGLSSLFNGNDQVVLANIIDITLQKRSEDAIRSLAASTTGHDSREFFATNMRNLAQLFNARYAFVGKFTDDTRSSIRTLAFWAGDDWAENFTYDLAGSLGQDIVNLDTGLVSENAAQRYPDDELLAQMDIEGYFGSPLIDNKGKIIGLISVMDTRSLYPDSFSQDVLVAFSERMVLEIERIDAEQYLAEEQDRARVTLRSVGDAVISTDCDGIVEFLNPVAENLTGWILQDAHGRHMSEVFKIISEVSRCSVPDPIELCLKKGGVIGLANHTLLIQRSGSEISIEDSAAPVRAKNGDIIGVVLVFRDVTEQRRMQQEILYQATHDVLTRSMNRAEFEKRLAHTISGKWDDCSLFYLDLDQFKVINDTCGHSAGDQLLRDVALVLRDSVRENDTVARLGGDEFGILLNRCPPQRSLQIANAILERIGQYRFNWDEQQFSIGISIGVVPIISEHNNVEEIMSAADAACYAAKDKGRNRIQVYQSDQPEFIRWHGEMRWVNLLKESLEEDRFCLYSQPIVPLGDVDKPGAFYELLLRVVSKDNELITPATFLGVAERYGLIADIDRWVIDRALSHIAKQGDDTTQYSINLSGASVADDDFIDYLRQRVEALAIPLQLLCFEITETAAIDNHDSAAKFIQEFKSMGCRFALDDFGSGLSSYGYLQSFPVDIIKIDGSFVTKIVDSPTDYAIVKSINDIAHHMNIQTIAEFVENNDIVEKLTEIGVDYLQGYAFGKPSHFLD